MPKQRKNRPQSVGSGKSWTEQLIKLSQRRYDMFDGVTCVAPRLGVCVLADAFPEFERNKLGLGWKDFLCVPPTLKLAIPSRSRMVRRTRIVACVQAATFDRPLRPAALEFLLHPQKLITLLSLHTCSFYNLICLRHYLHMSIAQTVPRCLA